MSNAYLNTAFINSFKSGEKGLISSYEPAEKIELSWTSADHMVPRIVNDTYIFGFSGGTTATQYIYSRPVKGGTWKVSTFPRPLWGAYGSEEATIQYINGTYYFTGGNQWLATTDSLTIDIPAPIVIYKSTDLLTFTQVTANFKKFWTTDCCFKFYGMQYNAIANQYIAIFMAYDWNLGYSTWSERPEPYGVLYYSSNDTDFTIWTTYTASQGIGKCPSTYIQQQSFINLHNINGDVYYMYYRAGYATAPRVYRHVANTSYHSYIVPGDINHLERYIMPYFMSGEKYCMPHHRDGFIYRGDAWNSLVKSNLSLAFGGGTVFPTMVYNNDQKGCIVAVNNVYPHLASIYRYSGVLGTTSSFNSSVSVELETNPINSSTDAERHVATLPGDEKILRIIYNPVKKKIRFVEYAII